MSALLWNFREILRPSRPARRRSRSLAVEDLDRRCLLSAGVSHAWAGHAAQVRTQQDFEHNGRVAEKPQFYEDYVGPRLAQLEAVAANGQLRRDGSFSFEGVNRGAINPNVLATYVFGVERNGNLATGPFPGRPNIRFDATVAIKIVPGKSPTVVVTDLANKKTTTVQDPNVKISGKEIKVVIPASLLPSTGLAPAQFRYAFWPEDGLAGSTNIASFAPATHDIRVGVDH